MVLRLRRFVRRHDRLFRVRVRRHEGAAIRASCNGPFLIQSSVQRHGGPEASVKLPGLRFAFDRV